MEYLPIAVWTLRPNISLNFEVFLKLNNKYVLYIKKGDDIEEGRLKRLIDKKTDRVFVPESDFQVYLDFIDEEVERAISDDSLSLDEKTEIVEGAAINAVDSLDALQNDPVKCEQAYRSTMRAANGLYNLVNQQPGALQKLFSPRKGKFSYGLILAHCKNVCALSSRLGFLLGFSEEELNDLSTAALVHDIGLSKLTTSQQKKMFEKRPENFSADDRTHYQNHPMDGTEIIQKLQFVTADVIKLVQAHEENKAGNGYPSGDSDLSDAEQVLSLCNLFDKMVTCYEISANQAYETLLKDYVEAYDWEIVAKLKDALIMEGIITK